MNHLHQPHLTQDIIILVQRQPVDADRNGAAAFMGGGNRRKPERRCMFELKLVTMRAPDAAIISSSSGRA